MNFELDDEQRMLRESVGATLTRQRETDPDAAAAWAELRDLGALALPFPDALGGLDGGPEEIMLVMEAVGRTLARVSYLQSVVLAGGLVAEAATRYDDPAAQELVRAIASGDARPAVCLFEPERRYAFDPVTTRVRRETGGWVLDGAKCAVFQADADTTLIVPARSDRGLELVVVPPASPGLTVETRPTPDGQSAADVAFASVRLPHGAAIGDPAENAHLLTEAVDRAIVAVCAEMAGAMDALLHLTVDYLGDREQFGAPLGTFQAVQHRAADMLVAIEQARSMTYLAIARLGRDARGRTAAVAAAKAFVNRSARFVGQQAVQLHGGMGMTAEYPAGRYFQRLTTLELLFGDTDHHLARYEAAGGFTPQPAQGRAPRLRPAAFSSHRGRSARP